MVIMPSCYAIGGFPFFLKKSFRAMVISSCWVVSISAAITLSCFLAATGTQKGIAVRPALSARFSATATDCGGAVFLNTPSAARADLLMFAYPPAGVLPYNLVIWL